MSVYVLKEYIFIGKFGHAIGTWSRQRLIECAPLWHAP